MIFEDILHDNKKFDANQMCIERFKSLPNTRLLPVFKYIRNATISWEQNKHLNQYVISHNTLNSIIPWNISKQLKNAPVLTTYQQIFEEIQKVSGINKKCGILLKNIQVCSIEEVRLLCQNFFKTDRDSAMSSTHFKRCVMYIDLSENYST